jgi:hypothetical protein
MHDVHQGVKLTASALVGALHPRYIVNIFGLIILAAHRETPHSKTVGWLLETSILCLASICFAQIGLAYLSFMRILILCACSISLYIQTHKKEPRCHLRQRTLVEFGTDAYPPLAERVPRPFRYCKGRGLPFRLGTVPAVTCSASHCP